MFEHEPGKKEKELIGRLAEEADQGLHGLGPVVMALGHILSYTRQRTLNQLTGAITILTVFLLVSACMQLQLQCYTIQSEAALTYQNERLPGICPFFSQSKPPRFDQAVH